ncbi:tuberin [Eupeodes corollae]|uniref:tuberin n=1 Tax=Eupeodes corollae TaxID=290404 RepID=UPI00249267F7|nr:tuberin [Eupeodes corollae]
MSSKDKDNRLNKVRQFFRSVGRSTGGNAKEERDLRPALESELRPETPVAQRCKTLKELGEDLRSENLDESSVTKLWDLTKDLIVDNKSTEHRQTTLTFYKILIQTQYRKLTLMREHFFLVIQNHEVPEDLKHRLELLIALTENGKDITHFEEKIGKFMLQWLPQIANGLLLCQYLDMLVNLIKFNAAHLDNEIVVGIVQNACQLSCTVSDDAIGLQCLNILELVLCYTIFPNETLALCVMTLCRTVNHIPYCQTSWKNMKKLLGTNLGYSSLLIMFNILNDKTYYNDPNLLRGAVFHINMGIFGSTHAFVFSPIFSTTSSVLMSFLHALESKKLIVTYEVILSIRKVVTKYGEDLPERIWDIICEILSAIADNIVYYEKEGLRKDFTLQENFHETIDAIEELMHADKLQANKDLIYDLIERVSESRPESSVLNLIDYRSKKISATKPEWLTLLNDFVCRFYRIPNTNIRVKTIHSLMQIMDASRASYEEEILQRVVIPQFGNIASEPDLMIRVVVCKALVQFATDCETKRCAELIDIMEKVLNRPFEQYALDESTCKSEGEIQDVSTVVEGLIRIFVVKLYHQPSSHAIKVFNILMGHLEQHYQKPKVFEHVSLVRSKIFSWMLKARANASYYIGYPDHECGTIRFSPYLGIESNLQHAVSGHSIQAGQEHSTVNCTKFSIRRACKIIVKCIAEDKDYSIFQLVVKELPQILQNKALILGNDMEALGLALCNVLPDPKSPPRSFHTAKPSLDECNALILPAIASLVIYHQYLSSDLKLRMIEAVKVVIRSNANAHICINTLSIMILEMPETLSRQLAEVLLEISKMSRTASVAIPVLEFLSILSRLPNDLFANFVPRHYMYVFAVSLSYTKPHPYDHYTVSLAHHVMTGWLLKCKMNMRKNFVMYIISGLQTDANVPVKDHTIRNEDSSSRQRSTSLTERVSRNRDSAFDMSDNLKSIQAELAETVIDFLARHTFSPCSTLPKRLPAIECMLKDGPSQTWLVGHNLVTITTNGCPSAPKANGLCDRCSLLMNKSNSPYAKSEVTGTPSSFVGGPVSPEILTTTGPAVETSNDVQPPNRRYTKASLQYSSGTESGTSTDLTSTSTSSSSQHQTHRQTSNSSSASLEALSRRGSNPEPENRIESSSVLGNSLNQLSHASSGTMSSQQPTCARSCTGWAEIYIRRPTGNISWIMHIQNPIANDCLGTDLPLSDLTSLFLPTMHGGVFGPDFVEEAKLLSPAPPIPTLSPREPYDQERPRRLDAAKLAVARVRALQRQEEVTSAVSAASGPIDIPKSSKRGKDPSGSLSDGEADEEGAAFEDGRSRARNPVRRVNSSPEMSSSLRKPTGKDFNISGQMAGNQLDQEEASKKKVVVGGGYSKDIRVSCEAIPEEIAGSTPPSQADSLKDEKDDPAKKKPESSGLGGKEPSLPPKQHSADDVTNQMSTNPVTGSASATNLKIPLDLQKLNTSAKQSAAPLSPRLLAKNAAIKVASFSSNVGGGAGGGLGDYGNNNMDMIRGRSKTISVVREVNGKSRTPLALPSFGAAAKASMNSKLGISPSFVFLQLFHNGQLQSSDPPLKVGSDNMATITLLDLIPPFETHKFGVLYVGPGQCNNEVGILRNRYGSVRYVEFLRSIGTLVSLKDAKENNLFVNMDTNGSDGNFTYIWKDDVVQITFHVATLMPNHENDPNCNEKKKHIGNDYVSIVYNESGEEYNLNTIKGQFNYACVVVQPLELNMNRVFVKARHEIAKFVCHPEPKIVSDRSAPLLARQLALHANLASHVYQSMKTKNPYASNWLERLRKIKNLRTKLLNETKQKRDAGKDEHSSWW